MKKGLSAAIKLPSNLCGVHDYVQRVRAELRLPKLSLAERQATLLDREHLRDLDVGSAQDSEVIYRGAHLPSGEAEIAKRLSIMTLRTDDQLLRAFVGCQLHAINPENDSEAEYLEEYADELTNTVNAVRDLESWDRSGAYAHAAIIHKMRVYWIANDLQLLALACRWQLRCPTGHPGLDGEFTGFPARSGAAAMVMDKELALAREVVDAYKELRVPIVLRAPNTTLAFGSSLSGGSVFRSAETFSARRYLPANDALVKRLETREEYFKALECELTWRREHAGELEDYIDWEMAQLECMLPKWGQEISRIRKSTALIKQRLINHVLPLHPLELLFLACERAILWCDANPGQTPSDAARLKLSKSQAKRAHRLFFALRFGIVRDTYSVPQSLQSLATALNGDVVRNDGTRLTFEEVLAAGLDRNDVELFSNNFSTRARSFAKANRQHEAVTAAWGTIGWRLRQ